MKYLSYLGLILGILMVVGCNNKDISNESTLYLNHFKSECGSFSLSLCMQSRVSLNDDWQYFYDSIEGFEYEWGYAYKIKVKVENIANPPQDGSSTRYTFLEIVEKVQEPAASLFTVAASRAGGLVTKVSEKVYKIYNDKEFSCSAADCATIDSLIVQDMAILFEFNHQMAPVSPLMLTQIKCSSARASFRNACL